MAYYDYSKLKPFIDAGIAPAKTNRAKAIHAKKKKLDEEAERLTAEFEKILNELTEIATQKAIKDFKAEKNLAVNQAYIATPKFAGKVLKIIITNIQLNCRKEPVLIAAIIGRDGGVRETKEINPISWDFVPAEKARTTAQV